MALGGGLCSAVGCRPRRIKRVLVLWSFSIFWMLCLQSGELLGRVITQEVLMLSIAPSCSLERSRARCRS